MAQKPNVLDIRIGTLVSGNMTAPRYIEQLLPYYLKACRGGEAHIKNPESF